MTPEIAGVIGIVALLVLLAMRVYVGIAMIIVAVAGYAYIVSPSSAFARLGSDAFASVHSYSLSVIPLFILMGMVLAGTRLGEDLYAAFEALVGRVRGGLGVATVGASSLFGAVSGSAVASASTISLMAIPEMRRYRYNDGFAAGCTAVGGTLGALIPPSFVLVLYGILTEESIGSLLIAAIVPGMLAAAILMLTAHLVARARPHWAPAQVRNRSKGKVRTVARVWPVPVIFGVSMGGIYLGVFTPTEAGAVGAFLALAYGIVTRRLNRQRFWEALSRTLRTSAMIFLIVIAGKMFGFFLSVSRIPLGLSEFVRNLDYPPGLIMVVIFMIYFALGALMDEIAILVIMTPVVYPVVIGLGYDGIWFGVLTTMMLLTGLLTPPVGLITFVVSGLTKIPIGQVFRGVAPFLAGLSVAILLIIFFPDIVLFLPAFMQ